MMFTRSELEEAELTKFYWDDDRLIDKVVLQVSSHDCSNNLMMKQVRVDFVIST